MGCSEMAVAKKQKTTSGKEKSVPKRPLTVSRPELLVDGSDRQFRRLVHAFLAFLTRHETIRSGHGSVIGLPGVDYTILISIGHLQIDGEPVSVNQLASYLHLSGAFVTTVTNKLLKSGLITKETDRGDRRKVRLSLTDKAWNQLTKLAPIQRQVNDVQFAPIQKEDLSVLVTMLEKLIDSSDQAIKLQAFLRSDLSQGGS